MTPNDTYSHRILRHMADRRYVPTQTQALATELGIDPDQMPIFEQAIQAMIADNRLVLSDTQTLAFPPPGREMQGIFRLNPRGFGFLIPDSPTEHGDLFVPQGNTDGAMTGDRVNARVIRSPKRAGGGRSPYLGKIIEIIQRADRRFVGNLQKQGSQWIIKVDGKHQNDPIIIRDAQAKNAKVGDKVVVELIEYPQGDMLGEGVIVDVLGKGGEPAVETRATMRAYDLPEDFPQDVLDQASQAIELFNQADNDDRLDLTHTTICTIDPPDARDFDDAIHLTQLDPAKEHGACYELGVHIADVSFFVQPGSALDEQAKLRGNSSYLPRKVIPMLPEVLSNGVCSLQEGVRRFCKSAIIRFDEDGNVLSERFANSVIESAKRLTYLEAQALIDDDIRQARKHCKSEPNYSREVIATLKAMNQLAKLIRQRRFGQGMIVLNLPDVQLIFDDHGHVVDAEPEDDAWTHTIIEMCMVEANEAAARLFHRLNVPMIRRIHADPPAMDMKQLRQFARIAGYNIPLHPTRNELQALLDRVRDKPAEHAVHLAVLKTLSRAEYAPLSVGHFALASEHYTHFTSPIRRYADLVVHRGLDVYMQLAGDADTSSSNKSKGSKNKHKLAKAMLADERLPDEEALVEIGKHLSTTERNSEAAERDLTNYLVLDLLSHHLGDDYDGTVTGVTGSGIFVQLDRFLVDGFVNSQDLPSAGGDRWQFNRLTGALVAGRSGQTITIGDRFTVRIAKVQPVIRKLDLTIMDFKKKSGQPAKSEAKTKINGSSRKKHTGHAQSKSSKKKKKHRKG